jgi:thioredoxin-like negative regulator of GroEL
MATLQALQAECGWVDPEVEAALPHNERDSAFFPLRRLIQENRRIIDLAIAQIGEAWAANPESTQLAHLLASAYLARADLRRQEARLATMEQTFL